MKNQVKILKKWGDSLRTKKFVKCPGKFQKILKILEAFRQVLKEESKFWRNKKKIDYLEEI